METAPTRSEMLRDVMKLAHEKHYHGEGDLWGWMHQERENALESGAHAGVLRSEEFCRKYWGVWLVAGPQLVVQKVTEAETTAWARHHEALKTAPDPLLYCFENLP